MKYKPDLTLKHPEFISRLPCVKCGIYGVDCAHLRKGSHAGIAQKPDDKELLPLCRIHHQEQHTIGEVSFWGNIDLARKLAHGLYLFSGQDFQAICLINQYRWKLF